MMITENYNVNNDVYTYQTLSHKVMFMQMNAKKGIKILGERSIVAMFKDYTQLDDGPITSKPVMAPFNPDVLTPMDKKKTS